MARSQCLKNLESRFNELRKIFLPSRFRVVNPYSDKEIELARAFSILFYAELEHYVESLAKHILDDARVRIAKNETPKVLISLFATNDEVFSFPKNITDIGPKLFISESTRKILGKHEQKIYNNKGVKGFNILNLFVPLGLNELTMDPDLIVMCNAYAADRGEIAHKPINTAIKVVDPRKEYERGKKLIKLFYDLEKNIF